MPLLGGDKGKIAVGGLAGGVTLREKIVLVMREFISLPSIFVWHDAENYAINLRASHLGLRPVGRPEVLLEAAGARNFRLPNGRILSVSADGHELFIDGASIGSLSSPFGAILPTDRATMVLTSSGRAEWIVQDQLRGPLNIGAEVELAVCNTQIMTTSLAGFKLKHSYVREAPLQPSDCRLLTEHLTYTFRDLENSASAECKRLMPVWIAWQMRDHSGRVIARGEPMFLQGRDGFVGCEGLTVRLNESDNALEVPDTMISAQCYSVGLHIPPATEEWQREQVATIEILATPPLEFLTGVSGGVFLNNGNKALRIRLVGGDSDSINGKRERFLRDFYKCARIVAVFDNPLAGLDAIVSAQPIDSNEQWVPKIAEPCALDALRSGSAVVFASAIQPGYVMTAHANCPLSPVNSSRVANGKILRILAPMGSGGGWNFSRQHLLVFAEDAIYSLSVDSSLRRISSSIVHTEGILRPDAVTSTPEAIYAATASGTLLKIKGSRCERIKVPFKALAVGSNSLRGELWVMTPGFTATIDPNNGMSIRRDINVHAFCDADMAIDTAGRLRSLAEEQSVPTYVEWHRQLSHPLRTGLVTWLLDAHQSSALTLSILAQGAAPVTSLLLSGPIDAPIRASFIAAPSPFTTLHISGMLTPPARLHAVDLS